MKLFWFVLLLAFAAGSHAVQRVSIATQLEPPLLDPTGPNPAAAISEVLYGNLYEGLVTFAPDAAVVPKLAESWEISADGLAYVFHLRRGVRYHDGTRFDAAVVKYNLDRARAPESVNPQRAGLQSIRSVEVIDPATVRIVLERRAGSLLQTLALGSLIMVAPQSAATDAVNPIGTGPFRFGTWRRGDSITLLRSPDYWGSPARLDEVTFKFITDPNAAYAALMAGDVDAYPAYPAPESFAQFQADPRFVTSVGSSEMETILSMNERHAPFDDVRVRRAISYALDRHAIIDGAMFGYGEPIGSHFPPHNPAYVDLTGEYPHDIARAKALLAAAGHPHGLDVTLKLPPPTYARRSGEIIAAQLREVGVRVTLENLEWAQWLDQVYTRHDFDLSIIGHVEPFDYDIYARDDYYFGYSSAAFKALLAALEDSIDPDRRRALLQDMQRQLADDAVNGFLFEYPRLTVRSRHVLDLGLDNPLATVDLTQAHLDMGTAGATRAAPAAAASMAWLAVAAAVFSIALLGFATLRFGSAFVVGRVGVLAVTLIVATAIVFVVVQVVPGDPVRYMLGLQADAQSVATLRRQLGLDQPAWSRYASWVGGLLHGDLGLSYTYRIPVRTLVLERLQVSIPLALYALLLTVLTALPLGMLAAARRGRGSDAMIGAATQIGLALPNFWLGMLLALIFAVQLHWLSAGGFPGWQAGFGAALQALTLPAIALAMPQAAILTRVLRAALLATLNEDYVRSARAKGASPARVLWRHALPNATLPVLTIVGLQFSFLLAGGVIIENVFFLPGLGRLVLQAITQRDLLVVQSVVMLLVLAVVLVTFIVDLSYALIDPRLRSRAAA